jgi:hypothetical protein
METDSTLTSALVQFFSEPDTWLLLALYMTPTILAILNKSAAWSCCFFVNLLFGWTFIGWIIAIVLAAGPTKAQVAHKNRVRRARDEFYLREDSTNRSPVLI